MANPAQFAKIAVPNAARLVSQELMDRIHPGWREDRPMAWAGLAAEVALCDAYIPSRGIDWMVQSESKQCDLLIKQRDCIDVRIEVKTRAVDEGWTDPRMFEWFVVPTHDGREPVKDVDLVVFCWYSGAESGALWVLGYLRGRAEFLRRAQFYREGQPLPRGGWAREGGAYCLEVKQLRPGLRGMFKEIA